MPVLTEVANENSTFHMNVAFKDEAGAAVVPDSINWKLTNAAGTVINSRSSVAVAVPSSTIKITLYSADLAVTESEPTVTRIVTISAVYDSTEGDNLPLKEEVRFTVKRLVGV